MYICGYQKTMMTYISETSNFEARFFYNMFLNQVHASHRPAHAWFLTNASVHDVDMYACMSVSVCMCVCVYSQDYQN